MQAGIRNEGCIKYTHEHLLLPCSRPDLEVCEVSKRQEQSVKNKASSKRLLYMHPYPLAAGQRWRDTGCCKVSIFCNKNHCGLKLSDLNLILHDTSTERTGGAGTLWIWTKRATFYVVFQNPHGKRVSAGFGAKKKLVARILKSEPLILKFKAHIFSFIIFGVFRWAIQWSKNLFFSVTFNPKRSLGH